MPLRPALRPSRWAQWHVSPLLPCTHIVDSPHLPPAFLLPFLSSLSQSPRIQPDQPCRRTLATNPTRLKASGGKSESNIARAQAKTASTPKDPFDMSEYEANISQAQDNLKAAFAKAGVSTLDPDSVEALRVDVGKASQKGDGGKGGRKGKAGSGKGEMVPLGDVASVMRRGRNFVVMVGEKEYLKPVLSCLHSHISICAPQTSPTEPLHITLPIPPTTQESRQAAVKSAQEKGQRAEHDINQARAAQKKRLRAMLSAREVGPDDLRRCEKGMERVNEKAIKEVRGVVEEAKRRLERG